VQLQLLDESDRLGAGTVSGEDGRFRLVAPRHDIWRISASLIGYGRTVSEPLDLTDDRIVDVEIRMAVEPVAIEEPLVVVGEVRYLNADIEGFHRRRLADAGLGTFIYGEDLDRRAGTRPTDLVRSVSGIRLMRAPRGQGQIIHMRGGCIPSVFIDGMQINRYRPTETIDDYLDSQSIEGIEIYRGTQPGGRFFDRHGCGLVLVWTRTELHEPGSGLPWTRILAVLAGMTLFFFLVN
jgi:hypothetical protein